MKDLRRSIEALESGMVRNCWPALDSVLAAAKKQLAEEEAKKPKRASLEDMEAHLRDRAATCMPGPASAERVRQAADILKALREVVVPWLRALSKPGYAPGRAEDMLFALGEEP